MKSYKILADSITGVKGKQLLKGQVHPESEFIVKHIPELVTAKLIEEVKAAGTSEETK